MTYALYLATFAGAVAMILIMPRRGYNPRLWGSLLGALALGGAWLWTYDAWLATDTGLPGGALPYYYIFSAIAIGAAVRVITHTRPVYSALWFIMVVLASAGLFLVLGADFMAFAMVIIYGGAILVTYVFVIMLASQAGDEDQDGEAGVAYDRYAREPVWGVVTGAILLALLLTVAFPGQGFEPNADAAAEADQVVIDKVLPNRSAARRERSLPADSDPVVLAAAEADAGTLRNVERVGLDLFKSHPLGLELAGVILLVALVGAVVIARMRVDTPPGQPPNEPEAN